jgi:hypothetical protein
MRRTLRIAALVLLFATPSTRAGDEPTTTEAPPATVEPQTTHRLWWWSIPRAGRTAVKTMAKRENAVITTCYRIERADTIVYEVHARRRTPGQLLKWDDIVLTSASEPRVQYEERQYDQTLSARMRSLRDKLAPQSHSFVPIEK